MPFALVEDRQKYNQQYHQEHKEEINQRKRERIKTEEGKEIRKQYELKNKERLIAWGNAKFNCECGGCYTRKNKLTHERSNMHIGP